MRLSLAALPLLVLGTARAHDTVAPGPEVGLSAAGLLLVAGLYALGFARSARTGAASGRAAAFAAGLLIVAAALVSPLAGLAHLSFAAHMVQHMLLVVVAAPLLALGAPPYVMARAVPLRHRRRLARLWNRAGPRSAAGWLAYPPSAWLVFALVLWVWHLPPLYDAAVQHPALHAFEHLSLLGASVLFWWVVLRPYRRPHGAFAALYLFTAMLHSGVLGALLTFASTPLYASYRWRGEAGLGALQDQQLAGLIMWVPSGLVMVLFAAALVLRELRHE